MTSVRLAAPGAAHDLAKFARRVVELDPEAVLRLLGRGNLLAAFAPTPLEATALRTTTLERPPADPIDRVVEAAGLVARALAAREGVLELPPALAPLRWRAALPPMSGWQQRGSLDAAAVVAAVEGAVATFRSRASLPPSPSRAAAVQAVADEVWASDLGGGVPVRLGHAALLLGFLAPDAVVTLHGAGAWRRLDATYGSVLARTAGDPLGVFGF